MYLKVDLDRLRQLLRLTDFKEMLQSQQDRVILPRF